MRLFLQDLRRALRSGSRRRGPFLAAVLILALAVGASTTVFSVVHGLLLVPLPVHEPERLVLLTKEDARRDFAEFPVFTDEFTLWQEETQGFDSLAGLAPERLWALRFEDGGEPATLDGAAVTGGFFDTLGVPAALGRPLAAEDSAPGAVPTVVLSHGLWQRRYDGDAGITGRSVRILGREHRVVGVAPASFDYPEGADLWFSLTVPPAGGPLKELVVIGRLAAGWDAARAYREVATLSSHHAEEGPEYLRQTRLTHAPWSDSIVGPVRRPLWILMTAVLLLVAVASTNIAHLMLITARRRQRQMALRAALGAGRGQLARQLLAEGSALALTGGALGIAAAALGVRTLHWLRPQALPRLGEVALHPGVLAFAIGVTSLATLVFSLLPALRATRTDPAIALRGGLSTTGLARDSRLLDALVVTEVALALVLLVGAGLLGRAFVEISRLDAGFESDNLLSVRLALSSAETDDRLAFHRRLGERLSGAAGIRSAAPSLTRPLSGSAGFDARILAEGQTETEGAAGPWINYEAATPETLVTLGMPLVEGRFVAATDGPEDPPMAVVNESLARHLWPDGRALGRRLRLAAPDAPWITVVGVVGDTRYRELTRHRLTLYLPFTQTPFPPRYLLVRTVADPKTVLPQIRRVIRARAPGVPVDDIVTVDEVLAAGRARPRFNALLMGLFAFLAALVALVGIYAVTASRVSYRLRELGIRSALGATPVRLLGSVLARGLGLAVLGVALGLAGALALSRTLENLLFEVRPQDPTTFLAVTVVFLGVALLALLLPARRAARVDPVRILRS